MKQQHAAYCTASASLRPPPLAPVLRHSVSILHHAPPRTDSAAASWVASPSPRPSVKALITNRICPLHATVLRHPWLLPLHGDVLPAAGDPQGAGGLPGRPQGVQRGGHGAGAAAPRTHGGGGAAQQRGGEAVGQRRGEVGEAQAAQSCFGRCVNSWPMGHAGNVVAARCGVAASGIGRCTHRPPRAAPPLPLPLPAPASLPPPHFHNGNSSFC